jgi:hypothetical protein
MQTGSSEVSLLSRAVSFLPGTLESPWNEAFQAFQGVPASFQGAVPGGSLERSKGEKFY